MRSTSFSSIVRKAARVCGLPMALERADWNTFRDIIDTRLAEAWSVAHWPEWEPQEDRFVRPVHDATLAYAEGAEVYDTDSALYYQASGDVPANTAISDAVWEEITLPVREIPYVQAGYRNMGDVLRVWDCDPRRRPGARPLNFELTTTPGVDLLRYAGNSCHIRFRLQVPSLQGEDWQADETYALGDQVYFATGQNDGDFFASITASNTGNAPSASPANWERLLIPTALAPWLIKVAQADWLPSDGQHEKSAMLLQEASVLFDAAQDLLARQQGQFPKMRIG
jgi:hypothetical protein